MKSETALQNEIRLAVGKLKDTRIFRNNVGMINGVQFGLCVGSSDLIGFKSVTITPEMVGQKVAIFTAIEVKTESGKVSERQPSLLKWWLILAVLVLLCEVLMMQKRF